MNPTQTPRTSQTHPTRAIPSGCGDLLGPDGYLRLMPATWYDAQSWSDLRLWCHTHARYGLPTLELVEWLRDVIGNKLAIEIGAGSGDLCHHLGIPGTDNRMQEWPNVQAYYQIFQQPVIRYPAAVHALDAEAAISAYRPHIVVASWITEWIDPNLPPPPHGGNMYGVKEDAIVNSGITYILIGNEAVHGRKRIMSARHETHALPFLRSRGHDRSGDRVYVWNGPPGRR